MPSEVLCTDLGARGLGMQEGGWPGEPTSGSCGSQSQEEATSECVRLSPKLALNARESSAPEATKRDQSKESEKKRQISWTWEWNRQGQGDPEAKARAPGGEAPGEPEGSEPRPKPAAGVEPRSCGSPGGGSRPWFPLAAATNALSAATSSTATSRVRDARRQVGEGKLKRRAPTFVLGQRVEGKPVPLPRGGGSHRMEGLK